MQTSLSWLHELVTFDLDADALTDQLTMIGTAVQRIRPLLPPAKGISVAEVISCDAHPRADHLSVCQIQTAEGERTLVCGAPNVRKGLRVMWIAPGGALADGTKIAMARLRGVESAGMLCSEAELGVSNSADSIMEVPPEFEVGTPAEKVFDDLAISFELTPNRPDCLSTFGIAREVGALSGHTFEIPEYDRGPLGSELGDAIKIRIDDELGCPRYAATLIEGLKVGPSPWWLKLRILACGMRPINNVVDVTNYVMMETGQPLHAFDYAQIPTRQIVVRASTSGESFTTLDSKSHQLPEGAVLITDGERPVALGGVMGGMNSEVSESTVSVLLESAYFDPHRTRKTRTALGIASEAALRFEKGTDPNIVPYALDRAAHLMAKLGGGVVRTGHVDVYPKPITPAPLTLRVAKTNQLLGLSLKSSQIAGFLNSISVTASGSGDTLAVNVPTFRPDLEREVDLIEEVARLYGYENIPIREQGGGRLYDEPDHDASVEEAIHAHFSSNGYNEAVTSSLGAIKSFAQFGEAGSAVVLANPLSEELTHLRPTLLADLASVAAHNFNHRSLNWRLYTLGLVFRDQGSGSAPQETLHLGLALAGGEAPRYWAAPERPASWWDLKGEIENLCSRLRVPLPEFAQQDGKGFEPNAAFEVRCKGEVIGLAGLLSGAASAHWDIKEPLWLGQLSVAALMRLQSPQGDYRPLPKYPEVIRDLALIVSEETPAGELERTIRDSAGELLVALELFDLYRGKPLADGTKNLAFNLRFQSPDQSLQAKAIDQTMAQVVDAVAKKHNATLRT